MTRTEYKVVWMRAGEFSRERTKHYVMRKCMERFVRLLKNPKEAQCEYVALQYGSWTEPEVLESLAAEMDEKYKDVPPLLWVKVFARTVDYGNWAVCE